MSDTLYLGTDVPLEQIGAAQMSTTRDRVTLRGLNTAGRKCSSAGGGTLSLKGADFAAPNQYQEFPLPFTFNASETFLIFQFWRSGLAPIQIPVTLLMVEQVQRVYLPLVLR